MHKLSIQPKSIFSFVAVIVFSLFISNNDLSAQVTIQTTDTKTNSSATVHSLTSVPAGALLVLTTSAGSAQTNCAVSSSPSLTWTKQIEASAASSGDAEIYTAVFTAGGSISVTSNWGTQQQASVCYVVTGQETTLGGASGSGVSQQFPSVSVTTTRDNSILFCVTSDWNAVNGSSRAYRNTPTERLYYLSAGNFTAYHYTKAVSTTSSNTMGLTAPDMRVSSVNGGGTAILEIRGPGSPDYWAILGNPATNPTNHFLGTTDAQRLVFRTNNTERATIDASGNIGIGTNSPSYKLDVNGTLKVDGTAATQVQFTGSNSFNPGFIFNGSSSNTQMYTFNSQNLSTATSGKTFITGSTVQIQSSAILQPWQQSLNVTRAWPGVNTAATLVLDNDVQGTPPAATSYKIWQSKFSGTEVAYLLGNGAANFSADATINNLTVGRGGGNVLYNTALGNSTLSANTGNYNTAIGYNALMANTSGTINTALGYKALTSNTTGANNTGIGANALLSNTTGGTNTAVGYASMQSNTTGNDNVAVGYNSLPVNSTGGTNVAVGRNALGNNTTGGANTALGYGAFQNNATGASNVAIGNQAGYDLTSGNNNIFIGSGVQPNISITGSNQLNIGNWIYGDNGNIGINASSPTARFHNNGSVRFQGLSTNNTLNNVLVGDSNGNLSWRNAATLGGSSIDWALLGNGGTTASNFLGTTDNMPLNIRTDNIQRLSVSQSTIAGSNNIGYVSVGQQSSFFNKPGEINIWGKDITGSSIPLFVAGHVAGMNWSASGGSNNTVGRLVRLSQWTDSASTNYNFFDFGIDQQSDFYITNQNTWATGGGVLPKKMITVSPSDFVGVNFGWGQHPTANFHTKGTVRHEGLAQNDSVPRILGTDVLGNVYWRDASTLGASGGRWALTGNAGTNPTTNFIGTTDAQPLVFKTNGTQWMKINTDGSLDYKSDAQTSAVISSSEYYGNWVNVNSNSPYAATGSGIRLTINGAVKTQIFHNDNAFAAGGAFDVLSGNAEILSRAGDVYLSTGIFHANGMIIKNTTGIVGIGTYTPNANAKLDVNGNIFTSGKIAIGTTDMTSIGTYSLAVNGDAIFNKVKVKLYTDWPDYVFDHHYHLPTLKELEAFIEKNKHLPGMPSADEIEKKGIDVGDNQALLLKKVEELTLYMIELNKKVDKLTEENESLKKKLDSRKD